MSWSNSKRSWASESICSVVRLFPGCEQEPQAGAPLLAVGESCYIDMELGKEPFSMPDDTNCVPSETPANATFNLHAPNGGIYCLTNQKTGGERNSSGPRGDGTELDVCRHFGFSFSASQTGAYIADARRVSDNKGLGKSVKCAKTIIGVADSLADGRGSVGFDRPVLQVLEVVPLNDPTTLIVGDLLTVQILFKGCLLPGACLTVVPRGKVLPRFGVENPYDMLTDKEGKAGFVFREPGYHLLVVHLEVEEPAAGRVPGVRTTRYTGDLTVMVRPKSHMNGLITPPREQSLKPLEPAPALL